MPQLNFCTECGGPLLRHVVGGEERRHWFCQRCQLEHHDYPRVVVTAFVSCGDRLLWVQRAQPPQAGKWAIPGGFLEQGETLAEGAARELREETGVEARAWRRLTDITLSNSSTDERGCLFLATDLVHGEADPDPTEALAIRWVPFEEALAMTRDGRITDVMSIAAIGRVALDRAMRG